ncbi:unnamed protein product [Rangifer tarandus platyrhynchus]|uniref:Uncharacterized protein n=1 Tax=Rangifer tarandus platyrhynchus TaxID=3082113 RepID=A0ABN8ZQC6_RANTA|nr:unnamed protein product [Rangifer tarandus platyrhynchus]
MGRWGGGDRCRDDSCLRGWRAGVSRGRHGEAPGDAAWLRAGSGGGPTGQEAQRPQAPRTRQGGQGRGSTPRGATGQGPQAVRQGEREGLGTQRVYVTMETDAQELELKTTTRGWDLAAGAGRRQPPAQWRGDRLYTNQSQSGTHQKYETKTRYANKVELGVLKTTLSPRRLCSDKGDEPKPGLTVPSAHDVAPTARQTDAGLSRCPRCPGPHQSLQALSTQLALSVCGRHLQGSMLPQWPQPLAGQPRQDGGVRHPGSQGHRARGADRTSPHTSLLPSAAQKAQPPGRVLSGHSLGGPWLGAGGQASQDADPASPPPPIPGLTMAGGASSRMASFQTELHNLPGLQPGEKEGGRMPLEHHLRTPRTLGPQEWQARASPGPPPLPRVRSLTAACVFGDGFVCATPLLA